MNPPTKGHQWLIDQLAEIANKNNADAFVFLSKTHTTEKQVKNAWKKLGDDLPAIAKRINNPLTWEQKIYYTALMNNADTTMDAEELRSAEDVTEMLQEFYDDITLIVGEDRYESFVKMASYMEKPFNVVSVGERTEAAEGFDISSISATRTRYYAIADDFESFDKMNDFDAEASYRLFEELQDAMLPEGGE
jgi:FAD synthase